MFIENFKLKGKLNILLTDQEGKVKENKTYPNLVVNTGKEYIAQRMTSNSTSVMSAIAVGDGEASPQITDITLNNELARNEISFANVSSNTVTYVCTLPAHVGVGGLVEAGIFNSLETDSGLMLCRTSFPVINKEELDILTITWEVSAL